MVKLDYTHRLERLLEITRKLSANSDVETFLGEIISAATELVGCDDCSILTYEEDRKALCFVAGRWAATDTFKTSTITLENSLAGWVYEHGQSAIVQDACQDPRTYHVAENEANFETGAIIAVPMLSGSRVTGVLETTCQKEGQVSTSDDVLILEILAAQVAVALQNARVLEKARLAYQQAVELDQMKTEFIGITSHELRTPLGLILGNASFLKESASEEQGPEVDAILRSTMRLKDIIQDFSNVDNFTSGMARLHRRLVDVNGFIQEIVDSFEDAARQKNIHLRSDLSKANLTLEMDAEKIGMVLTNLIKNALEFSNPGGHVLVKAEILQDNFRVSVSDDGIGIPAKDIKKLFERFYQVESHLTRKHGGMGLGLSIAKDMVELHGGRIWAESVEGHGSRITFILPVKGA